jgi:CBS domain-containing protein
MPRAGKSKSKSDRGTAHSLLVPPNVLKEENVLHIESVPAAVSPSVRNFFISLNIMNSPGSKQRGAEIGGWMQLREIMTTDVEVIRPETCVSQATQKMRSLDVGVLPVCEGRRLVGMVTDRNITTRATAYGHDPNTTPVRHYMSSDLIWCFEDQDIKEAEELMRQRRVRRLPILTRAKQIAGIVALDDLAILTGAAA